eukprot:1159790-Pelagomonas_calceolata.AAC.2
MLFAQFPSCHGRQLCLALVAWVASTGRDFYPLWPASVVTASLMILTGCMTGNQARQSMDWVQDWQPGVAEHGLCGRAWTGECAAGVGEKQARGTTRDPDWGSAYNVIWRHS